MIRNVVLSLLLSIPILAGAQSQLRVPRTEPQQCEGSSCDIGNDASSTGREPSRAAFSSGVEEQPSDKSRSEGVTREKNPTAPFPISEPTEFQKFVISSTGQSLPIYGQSMFRDVPSTFAPVDQIPVPAEYTIGPDDQLLIRAWGQIDLDAKVVVDRNGQIYLPKVGTLTVAGIRYDQLQSYLQSNVGRLFKNFSLNVTLGRLRSIQVFVVGRAKRPGAYTVGSLSTMVNALFASGGPDTNGSMRRISIRRQDRSVAEFDLYDLLVNGDKSNDVVLRPGDVIYISPVGPQVAIAGSVNLPAIYELRDANTVADLLDVAGGLSTTADNSRAILERIENRTTRKVEEFSLNKDGLAKKLSDGDILRIFPVSPRFDNAVTLRGNVAQPGRYPWRQGMQVHDLIPSRKSIITADFWARQNDLGRNRADWIDRNLSNKSDEQRTEIRRNPSEINWDYAVIQRLNNEDLSSRLIPFNLGKAIAEPSGQDNVSLEPGDVITVFSQQDLVVPDAQKTKFVQLQGEIKAAGVYQVLPGETLRDVVSRAGGLTPNAYLYAAEFRRESTRRDQQKKIAEAANQMEAELAARGTRLPTEGGTPEEIASARTQLESDRQLLQSIRSTVATGRIVLEIDPTDDNIDAIPEMQLEDGDNFIVPSKPKTVQVVGSVYNQNAFVYREGKTIKDYLKLSGGGTKQADSSRMFVIRADGSVNSKQTHSSLWFSSFESMNLMPGDTIVMPQKVRGTTFLREFRDWTQIFAQVALGAASIKVISQ